MKHEINDLLLLQTHNPVPETHESKWAGSDAGRALFSQIERNVGEIRHAPSRPRWRRPTVTIPAFIALSGSALLFASAIAGSRTIGVDAREALQNPEKVERYLADEGIEASIVAVPVRPPLVGKWFHLYLPPDADIEEGTFALLKSYVGELDFSHPEVAERCLNGYGCDWTDVLEIPGEVKGPITLVVGREAQPHEGYWARNIRQSNELAPSGALYCMQLEDKTSGAIERRLESDGYEIRWTYEDGQESRDVAEPPAGSSVTVAYIFEPGVADIRVSPQEAVNDLRVSEGTPTRETGRPDFGPC